MNRNLLTRYNFALTENGIVIQDKFNRINDIELTHKDGYVDLSMISQFSPSQAVMFLHTSEHKGDLICFDARTGNITPLAKDCSDKMQCRQIDDQFVLISAKQNKEPVYIYVTENGQFYAGHDKEFFEEITKVESDIRVVREFENGNALEHCKQTCLGYSMNRVDLYDKDGCVVKQICFTPNEVNFDTNSKGDTIITFEDKDTRHKEYITSYGTYFGLSQKTDTPKQSNALYEVLYSSYDYCLVQEQLKYKDETFLNLYIINADSCTQETLSYVADYYETGEDDYLGEMISNDGTIQPFATNLTAPPKVSAPDENDRLTLRYTTKDQIHKTVITPEGTPFTLSKPIQNNEQ